MIRCHTGEHSRQIHALSYIHQRNELGSGACSCHRKTVIFLRQAEKIRLIIDPEQILKIRCELSCFRENHVPFVIHTDQDLLSPEHKYGILRRRAFRLILVVKNARRDILDHSSVSFSFRSVLYLLTSRAIAAAITSATRQVTPVNAPIDG